MPLPDPSPQRTIVGTPLFDADVPAGPPPSRGGRPQIQWLTGCMRVDLRHRPCGVTFLVEPRRRTTTGGGERCCPRARPRSSAAGSRSSEGTTPSGLRATRRGYRHVCRRAPPCAIRERTHPMAGRSHRNRHHCGRPRPGRRVCSPRCCTSSSIVLAGHHHQVTLWSRARPSSPGPESWLGSDIARARATPAGVLAWRATTRSRRPATGDRLPAPALPAARDRPAPAPPGAGVAGAPGERRGALAQHPGADAVVVTDAQGRA